MKKRLYTVCVDNYFPELMEYTLPNLKSYADRIGAEFVVIKERQFPDFPPTYEKLQIRGEDSDWTILVDADTMLHPQTPDLTMVLPPDYVGSYMQFDASLLFEPDEYFFRDGRRIGVATNLVVAHRACRDLWTPLEFGWDIAKTKTKREFIIDEYCISRNVARFGLKKSGLFDGDEGKKYLQHFDLTTELPDRNAVVEKAKALTIEWSKL
jgi:hypothetical protein